MSDLRITGTAGYSMANIGGWKVLGTTVNEALAYVKPAALAEELTTAVKERDELREALRQEADFLDQIANVLDTWADDSRKGGWSTHQVGANQEQANACRREAASIRKRLANLNKTDEE